MIKVYLKGPLLTQSGYGHHARTVFRALKTRSDLFDIYVQPIPWGATSWIWENSEERGELDFLLTKTIQYISSGGKFDVSVQVTIPNEFELLAPVNIGVTAGIETDKVSGEWLQKCNQMTKIITISEHAMRGFTETIYDAINEQTGQQIKYGLQVPISYVSYPVLEVEPEDIDLNLTTDFNFLAIAQMGPRKNLEMTIDAFVEEFRDNENVGLVIKTNTSKNSLLDRLKCKAALTNKLASLGEKKCKVYLLHGYMTEGQLNSLYNHEKIKCLVSTTHGEGFGLPLFEAAYNGLPVIATDWSGHLDFLYKKTKQKNGKEKSKHMFGRISYKLANIPENAVWEKVMIPESKWALPEVSSVKSNMTQVYKDHGRFLKRATELKNWLHKEFSEEKIYSEYVSHFEDFTSSLDEEVEELFNQLSVE